MNRNRYFCPAIIMLNFYVFTIILDFKTKMLNNILKFIKCNISWYWLRIKMIPCFIKLRQPYPLLLLILIPYIIPI